MGNKQNKSKGNPEESTAKGDNKDKMSPSQPAKVDEEAQAFIQLTLIRVYPSGSEEQSSMDVQLNMLVTDFLTDLQTKFTIPAERILIYRHNGNVPMPIKKTLFEMGLKDGDILRVKDGSL